MNILIYLIVFIIGTYFGTFVLYTINSITIKEKNKDEKFTCKYCNNTLSIIEMIPVFSYIFLRGKCKHCGKKIDSNYLLIEFLMGIISLGIYISIHGIWNTMSISLLTEYLFMMIFIITLCIIAGVDKKSKKVYRPILFIGIFVGFIHLGYLYINNNIALINIHKYISFFVIFCILSFITYNNHFIEYKYLLELLSLCIYINMFEISEVFLITSVLTMIFLVLNVAIKKHKMKIDKNSVLVENNIKLDIPIAYWLCISNIIAIIIQGIIV